MSDVNEDYKKLIDLIEKLLKELEKPDPCFNSISIPMQGSSGWVADASTALADATLDANAKLTTFGEKWCGAGKCDSATCAPTLSGLEVTAQTVTERVNPTDSTKTEYSAKVTLKGTVSCFCK
jgi:hypothetical protein